MEDIPRGGGEVNDSGVSKFENDLRGIKEPGWYSWFNGNVVMELNERDKKCPRYGGDCRKGC